jgi:hypothetical protein
MISNLSIIEFFFQPFFIFFYSIKKFKIILQKKIFMMKILCFQLKVKYWAKATVRNISRSRTMRDHNKPDLHGICSGYMYLEI